MPHESLRESVHRVARSIFLYAKLFAKYAIALSTPAADKKELGMYYEQFAFFFSLVGALLSVLMRLELSPSGLGTVTVKHLK